MMPNLLVPLANHLWQSTLFAAAMALLALALRRNQARVRYWLWAAASYKFLFPFSWLVSLGHRFEWHAAPRVMSSALSVHLADAVSGPLFLTASFPPASVTAVRPPAFFLMAGIWACGFVIVTARWGLEWWRIRAVVQAASPLALALPIRVVSTAARLEPGVFGIFSPVLVLPEGIADRLTRTQLRAIFVHELCHVRRRDNLTAAVHMLVEALFWFHPLVWWLGARMVDERERACDEDVLQTGSHAQAYAESILKVCEFYLESPLTCISGVTGSNLKKRIQRIMKEHFGMALSARKKWLLVTAGVAALTLPVVVGMLMTPRLQAQDPLWPSPGSAKLTFEVASIKLNKSTDPPHWNIALGPGDFMRPVGGLFQVSNEPLAAYIAFAYKLTGNTQDGNMQFLMSGLPSWVNTENFDIEARAAGTPKKDEFRLMMQSLLADRFKLTMHRDTRQMPVFALVLSKQGKTGPQITPHTDETMCAPNPNGQQPFPSTAAVPLPPLFCGAISGLQPSGPGRIRSGGRKVPMKLIASYFSGYPNFERPIVDGTGLAGTFDFWFEWAPQPSGAPPPGFQFDPTGPTPQEALLEQLGLKLESQMAPMDVMVVDHIEQPSEN